MKQWVQNLLNIGLVPYIATSEAFINHLNTDLFEGRCIIKLLENPAERNFHEAYLVSNSLGFGNPDLKMPNWVYIDCVLMQTAVVGFAVPVEKAPDSLVEFYERDPYVDVKKLDYIPVSGQIAALGIDGQTLTGFSLFSLRRQLSGWNVPQLAPLTKSAALYVYNAQTRKQFTGISQYNNRALKTHALFGKRIYIERTTMPLHPLRDMSFTYSMKIELDDEKIMNGVPESSYEKPDFLLRADDVEAKLKMQEDMNGGARFYIAQPVHIVQDDAVYLPICQEKNV